MTVKEASRSGPAPPTTRHTYSPESAGETWWSRSREPWVCQWKERAASQAKALGPGKSPRPAVPAQEFSLGPRARGSSCVDELRSQNPTQPTHFTENETGSGNDSAAEPEKPGCLNSQAGELFPSKVFSPLRPPNRLGFAVQKATAAQTWPALKLPPRPPRPCT